MHNPTLLYFLKNKIKFVIKNTLIVPEFSFFCVDQTDMVLPLNWKIRMLPVNMIIPYPQKQQEFIDQSGFTVFTSMRLCDVIDTQNEEQ